MVDDQVDLGDVEASAGHVCGDKHLGLSGLEGSQTRSALLLSSHAVQDRGAHPHLGHEEAHQLSGSAGLAEDDDGVLGLLLPGREHKMHQVGISSLRGSEQEPLVQLRHCVLVLYTGRLPGVGIILAGGEDSPHIGRVRGCEEQGLSVVWQSRDYSGQLPIKVS